jgi:methylated-DNA-[protein]-cysteine S-methyltransferase
MSRRSVNQPLAEGCHYDTVLSPLGNVYLVVLNSHLINVSFLRPRCRKGVCPERTKAQFEAYFSGDLRQFDIKMDFISGTQFERAVWQSLKNVVYGETRSYKWLAEEVKRPNAARAVGNALTKNPFPIVLPCHRIIESDNSLGGYSFGADLKRRLLDMEYYFSMSN